MQPICVPHTAGMSHTLCALIHVHPSHQLGKTPRDSDVTPRFAGHYTPALAGISTKKSPESGFDKQTSFPRAAPRVDIVSRLASAGAHVRSRCAAGHARLPCDDPSAARYLERRCVCLILAVGVHLRYRTSQSTLQPGVFRRHAHSENSNSHTHEMYNQRFVGLSAQLREKQGLQTSTSSSARR